MFQIILFSLAASWVFKYHVKERAGAIYYIFTTKRLGKPFTCFTCMSGWLALIGALITGYGWQSILICFVAMALSDIISSLQMRWL
jgi:hypothetical protein